MLSYIFSIRYLIYSSEVIYIVQLHMPVYAVDNNIPCVDSQVINNAVKVKIHPPLYRVRQANFLFYMDIFI
jgi:hypothetical protein